MTDATYPLRSGFWTGLRAWWMARATRSLAPNSPDPPGMEELSDHLLDDVGLSRHDRDLTLRKPLANDPGTVMTLMVLGHRMRRD